VPAESSWFEKNHVSSDKANHEKVEEANFSLYFQCLKGVTDLEVSTLHRYVKNARFQRLSLENVMFEGKN